MVHARVSFWINVYDRSYFLVLPTKYLTNEDGEPTTPYKLAIGKQPSVSHVRVLFFPCVVQKATARVDKKALNIRHQAKKGFHGIFFGISQHQKWYIVYLLVTRRIIYSHTVVFDEIFASTLA